MSKSVYIKLPLTDIQVKPIRGPVYLIACQHWNILDDRRGPKRIYSISCSPFHGLLLFVFVFFFLVNVLSVLRLTACDYIFGIQMFL